MAGCPDDHRTWARYGTASFHIMRGTTLFLTRLPKLQKSTKPCRPVFALVLSSIRVELHLEWKDPPMVPPTGAAQP